VDKSGLLLTLGGLTTLAFELGFILLIWNRYTRLLAAAMGLFFHALNIVTLNIKFYWAMILYVTFVDWEWLSRRALRRREPLVFAFDAGCGLCKQTAAALSTAGLPGGFSCTSAQDLAAEGRLPSGVELAELLTDIYVLSPGGNFRGFAAYRRIAWRVPFLWPFLPFLYLPPVASLGNRVYRRGADHRLCHVNDGQQAVGEERPRPVRFRWTVAPTLIGALILAAMIAVIPTEDTNAWPVALYPTFAGIHQPLSQKLVVVVRDPTSDSRTVALKACFPWMPTDRYQGLVRQTIQRASRGSVVLVRELVRAAARDCPQLRGASKTFSFYNDKVDTQPGEVGRLESRTVLLRWTQGD
jgi:predicted DCC family thiol-disulfide oxidoreductase YuxK